MKRVLIFGGTTEGRLLCEALAHRPIEVTVCVATAYGQELLAGLADAVNVRTGRMDQLEIEALMQDGYDCVIDATHPYAVVVSETIRVAAQNVGMRCIRLQRPQSETQAALHVPSVEAAAALLRRQNGNVLVTTGVKELEAYTVIDDYAARIYPRVLPTEASIARCVALGFAKSHIVAMQGPFSQALNEALLRQLDCRWLVTKDGGDYGGFMAKIDAAERCAVTAVVVGRPMGLGGGCDVEAVLAFLDRLL